MIVDELIAVLGYDIRDQQKLNQWKSSLDQAASAAGRFAGRVADVMGGVLVGAVASAKTAMVGLGAGVISTGAAFEKYGVMLETLEGSSEAAKESLDWINTFAVKTPYGLDESVQAFIKLKSYGIDAMDGMLSSAGDWAAGMGKSLDQVVEAIADARTGEMERLKELGLRGSSDRKAGTYTFTWSENGTEFKESVKQTTEDVDRFLRDYAARRFGGAMDKLSGTWGGMVSNLADQWTRFLKLISDSGVFEGAKKSFQSLLDTINEAFDDGTAKRWAEEIGAALTRLAQNVGVVIERLRTHFKFFDENRERLARWWAVLQPIAIFLAMRAFPVATALAAVAVALDDLFTYMEGGESVIGSFIHALQDLTGMSQSLAETLTGALAAALAGFVLSGGLKASAALIGRTLIGAMFSWVGAAALIAELLVKALTGVSLFDEGYRLGQTLIDGIVKAITENDLLKKIWNAPREALEGIFKPETPEQMQAKVAAQKPIADRIEHGLVDQFGPVEDWFWGLGRRHADARKQQPAPAPGAPAPAPAIDIRWPAPSVDNSDLAEGLKRAAATRRGEPAPAPTVTVPPITIPPAPAQVAPPSPQSAIPAADLSELARSVVAFGQQAAGWASANRDALQNFSGNADRAAPERAIQQIMNDNSVANDNREYPFTVNQTNNNTVNVTQAAQAAPAVGTLAAQNAKAVPPNPARLQQGSSF